MSKEILKKSLNIISEKQNICNHLNIEYVDNNYICKDCGLQINENDFIERHQ